MTENNEARDNERQRYSVLLQWSDERQLYFASVPEVAGCEVRGATRELALRGCLGRLGAQLYNAKQQGKLMPKPLVVEDCSDTPRTHGSRAEAEELDECAVPGFAPQADKEE